MSVDYLFCSQAETAYRTFIDIIETVLSFPTAILNTIRNSIKQIEVLIFRKLLQTFEYLEDLINSCIKTPANLDDVTGEFCTAILNCEFLYKSLLPAPETNGKYKDPISGDDVSAYEWIKRSVCGYGLSGYITYMKGLYTSAINEFVDELSGVLGFNYVKDKVQEYIESYNDYLRKPIKEYYSSFPAVFNVSFGWANTNKELDPETANIFDLIDFLNLFANCVFSVCDLSSSVANKITDIERKLSVSFKSRKYIPKQTEIYMLSKINEMERFINNDVANSPCAS